MSTVNFEITLDPGGPNCYCRLDVDVNQTRNLAQYVSITLATLDRKKWTGKAQFEPVDGTYYNARISAPKGTKWDLKAWTAADEIEHVSGTVLVDPDEVGGKLG